MKILVPSHKIKKNILLFKEILETKDKEKTRNFSVFVNCKTGQLVKRLTSKTNPAVYKKISIKLTSKLASEDRCVIDLSLRLLGQIEPPALEVIHNTHHFFNVVCQSTFSLEETVKKISKLSFALKEEDIFLAAWHEIDRRKTEELLLDSARGTFLFRKDEFARELEKQINHHCFTLSYLSSNHQVVDRTIVQKGKRNYQFFNDDITLQGKGFPSLKALIESLGNDLMIALPVEA